MGYVVLLLVAAWILAAFLRRTEGEPVKVVEHFSDAAEGEVFRLTTDRPNVLRFQPPRPEGFTLYGQGIGSGDPVAGTSYRQEAVLAFIDGQNRRLEVEYAPTEEFPEAIKVMGVWEDRRGTHQEHIGYVPAEIAKEIYAEYKDLPIAAELRTIYKPIGQSHAGVRMWLLRAKYPKRFGRGSQPSEA